MSMIHELTTTVPRYKKSQRKGRGESSGRGKTCGRGTKGSKARVGKYIKRGAVVVYESTVYPGATEETILTEIVANSLDSGAASLRVTADPVASTLTIVDDGSGMRRRDLVRYHDLVSSKKTRGHSIGFAGVQRDEATAEPMEYYTKFPSIQRARVLVLEEQGHVADVIAPETFAGYLLAFLREGMVGGENAY